ncbi:hypothetical protein MGG_17785 [Pyricularia oryzae 70-15]|uniref:Uncharacterized protein n=2 Tax=Pyricularia oryzae TaxID=318829 RepID=G4NHW6_PYRO7|nr:uncharacterized protein MGG_17785 [Pyricularia oryzae 70-15]EHA47827.1 hypothetical protein MGG_17785 [Pyricularia oryzae 70-15]KAI7912715.1 hypothetical protein M9X92_009858 [Pyricularia oryzae]KAI7915874.1 hypothetical protein M0657_008855 [Pyricularia oryzae]QBZ65064.1 hypothetical protein PoMZ_06768 [Pyricularia oryzae]
MCVVRTEWHAKNETDSRCDALRCAGPSNDKMPKEHEEQMVDMEQMRFPRPLSGLPRVLRWSWPQIVKRNGQEQGRWEKQSDAIAIRELERGLLTRG